MLCYFCVKNHWTIRRGLCSCRRTWWRWRDMGRVCAMGLQGVTLWIRLLSCGLLPFPACSVSAKLSGDRARLVRRGCRMEQANVARGHCREGRDGALTSAWLISRRGGQYLNELPPRNSRRMEVGGISRVGTGCTYEKNFSRRSALECSGYFDCTSASSGTACCFKAPSS